MSAHAYTEDQLVEQPTIGLFAEHGWQTVSALEEIFGKHGTLGRETPGEVVLVGRLRAALVKLNASRLGHDALPPEAIDAAIDELTRDGLRPRLLSGQAALPHAAFPKGRGAELAERGGVCQKSPA